MLVERLTSASLSTEREQTYFDAKPEGLRYL
jgi:hypothetical protein